MKKKKFSLITSSRADYDQLFWLIKKIKNNRKNNLHLIVSGSHLIKKYGYTVNKIKKDKLKFQKLYLKMKGDKPINILNIVSDGISKFSKFLNLEKPDYLIILGDRYEILSAAVAASFLKIPIIHLNGGELTFGAHDDWIRHCITKMANIHFVANSEYKKRVIQLGENPKTVFNTGGLSSDNALKTKLLDRNKIKKNLNIEFKKRNILITYHPEIYSNTNTKKSFLEIIKVIKYFKKVNFFFTFPNADEENKVIIDLIKKLCLSENNCKFFLSLGRINYLSLVKNCDLVLGNSSSGLLEVPYLNAYTINIGNRQQGRVRAKSVFDCKTSFEEIKKMIKHIFLIADRNPKRKFNLKDYYGEGKSAENMLKILNTLKYKFDKKKVFNDLWKNI